MVLFSHFEEELYLRELVRAAGKGHGVVQRELGNLVLSGVITKEKKKGRTYYSANKASPIYQELKAMIRKTAGLVDQIRESLEVLPGLQVAFIFGSMARGEERPESDIDLAVITTSSFTEVASALAEAQARLGREINPTVYPPGEFSSKARAKNHFVRSLLSGEKIFVIGSSRELERLAQ